MPVIWVSLALLRQPSTGRNGFYLKYHKEHNMFDNTFTLSVLGSDRVLTRVNNDKFASTYRYRSGALNIDMLIRHTDRPSQGKPGVRTERHNVEITATQFTTVDNVTTTTTAKAYFVFEMDTGQSVDLVQDLLGQMSAVLMTDAISARLANWES
ncbi:MAG: hypothetical protein [Grapevine-associated levi-like virus 1]|uniref:Coat protein n=1 Tax=Grapevine-associated levi-like virus 1 TaxID=2814354 RepID=A0A8F5MKY1_9VIRU|nr:MAG: hypothetical protein [Grapevine-associated levi-like virus 1]